MKVILCLLLFSIQAQAFHAPDHHNYLRPSDWLERYFEFLKVPLQKTLESSKREPDSRNELMVMHWQGGFVGSCSGKVLGLYRQIYLEEDVQIETLVFDCTHSYFEIQLKRKSTKEALEPLSMEQWLNFDFPDPYNYEFFELRIPDFKFVLTSLHTNDFWQATLIHDRQGKYVRLKWEELNLPVHFQVSQEFLHRVRGEVLINQRTQFESQPVGNGLFQPRWYLEGREWPFAKINKDYVLPLESALRSLFN